MDSCPLISNPDISGTGIRISFYVQAVCLALLSVRSPVVAESGNAMSTMIVTNIAYAVTTLVLGLRPKPDITLYDALIVVYLLTLAWFSILFALPHYSTFKASKLIIKILAIVQGYFSILTGFLILGMPHRFDGIESKVSDSPSSSCVYDNANLNAAIFVRFKFLGAGRIAFLVVLAVFAFIYTVLLILDLKGTDLVGSMSLCQRAENGDGDEVQLAETAHKGNNHIANHNNNTHTYDGNNNDRRRRHHPKPKLDGTIVFNILLIITFAAISIANTELLRKFNNPRDDDTWTFGQMLPMFLTVLPVFSTFEAFKKYGLGPDTRKKKKKSGRPRRPSRQPRPALP